MCGGTGTKPWRNFNSPGLSPRARGNPVFDAPMVLVLGTIPACAGEPTAFSMACSRRRDYPRVRGGTM